jgi:hypothetical protein
MKFLNILKYCFLMVLVSYLLPSCEKDTPSNTSEKDGPVVVHYIRSTDPGLSDSLLVGAFMGSLVSIVGDNFGDLKELWFNDQKAILTPNFITDKTIIVSVPSTVPVTITDEIRMVFSDGSEFKHPFKVNVPSPVINSVKSEYVEDGGIIELRGDFYFNPLVTFTGDVNGEIVSVEKTLLKVKVPEGAQVGPVTVKTAFGKAVSKFLFRDDRNTIINFDDKGHVTWTAPTFAGENNGVRPLTGKFAMFSDPEFGEWKWNNPTTLWFFAPERNSGAKQLAVGNPNDFVVKFEINVPVLWEDFNLLIFMSPYANDHGYDNASFARFQPWRAGGFKTDGWETVTIPLSAFQYSKDDNWSKAEWDKPGSKPFPGFDGLTNINMMMFGPNVAKNAGTKANIQIGIDNIRIVPIN